MTNIPSFLQPKPTPLIKQRLYNGRRLTVFEGKVKISDIKGWVDNPRIELAKKKLLKAVGNRELTQDEIMDLMKNDPDVKLNVLRDDILKNGLREPLTLNFEGKLLDGNRRYFAMKYALAEMPASNPNKQDFELIDVYILNSDASEQDEQNVLVEENFSDSLKIAWPEYIRSMRVISASEAGLSPQQIAEKFNWKKPKVVETLRIAEILIDFMAFATSERDPEDPNGGGLGLSEQDAEAIVSENYQFFNEAQKSFFQAVKTDFDFKTQFFKWIYEKKFSSFHEVRVAHAAWKNPEAKAAIMQPEPTAAKAAKAILDYNSRVSRSTDEAVGRIDTFVKFLYDMTVAEMNLLPQAAKDNLEKALQMVVKMSRANSE